MLCVFRIVAYTLFAIFIIGKSYNAIYILLNAFNMFGKITANFYCAQLCI